MVTWSRDLSTGYKKTWYSKLSGRQKNYVEHLLRNYHPLVFQKRQFTRIKVPFSRYIAKWIDFSADCIPKSHQNIQDSLGNPCQRAPKESHHSIWHWNVLFMSWKSGWRLIREFILSFYDIDLCPRVDFRHFGWRRCEIWNILQLI